MKKYNKIYVVAPYKAATGGVELGHQLVDYLRKKGEDAYIVYEIGSGRAISNDTNVTECYNKYNIKVSSCIDDDENNILVLPEVYFEFIYKYTKIRIACWWMSVDNRYSRTTLLETLRFNKGIFPKLQEIKRYITYNNSFRKNDNAFLIENDKRIIHLYQSAYAQFHLYSKGFSKVLPLSDYINTTFVSEGHKHREDIILYNPKKGARFTKKLIESMPNCTFVALQGLNRDGLVDLMQKAKVYIDFGHFPGKDRLPREAILNGCCIITGKAGASFFYEDVAIPENYKIEAKTHNIKVIKKLIRSIFDNYSMHVNDMHIYKKRILAEEQNFYKEIDNIFL